MSLFLKMNQVKDQLTNSEQKIASCVLDDEEEVYNLSIQDLAKKCNTSPSSIVRFCKKMGFEGFQDFKIELAKGISDSKKSQNIVYEDVRVDDTIEDIVGKISAGNIKSIENTVTNEPFQFENINGTKFVPSLTLFLYVLTR